MLPSVANNPNAGHALTLAANNTSVMSNMLRMGSLLHAEKGKAKRRQVYLPLSTDFAVV